VKTMVLDVSGSRVLPTRLLGRVWRGAYFAATSPLKLIDLPDPPLPAPGWVRVRNRLCCICGSERTYLGHEMVGDVIEVGEAVDGVALGDRVVRWGRAEDCLARGYAALCPACARGHRVLCQRASEPQEHAPVGGGFGDTFITPAASLVPVPGGLLDEQAIFAEPAAVAIHAAGRVPVGPGDQVLVLGCGTIGFLLIQVLRILEPACQITAVAQFPWQAEMARDFGADHTFLACDDGFAEVARLTGARLYEGRFGNRMLLGGFDRVFDVVGTSGTLNQALRWTRAGGTAVLVGVDLHRLHVDLTPVWYQEVDLLGAIGHAVTLWEGEPVSDFELAMRWMQAGSLRTDDLLTHRFPLDEYRRAFQVATDKARFRSIKVAFDLT